MIGSMLAGHSECPGELIEEDGKKYKLFYGMSSEFAMKKHYGEMAKYRSSEGRVIKVPYRGSLENTVLDYLGGLRSTCAYTNAYKIKHLPKCTTFILTSQQLNTHFVKLVSTRKNQLEKPMEKILDLQLGQKEGETTLKEWKK